MICREEEYTVKSLIPIIAILAMTIPCHADTLTVNPDGSAQYSNLSEALQRAQPDDTVLLQPGLYQGGLNRELYFWGGSITIESEQGPQTCIIDCESNGRFLYVSTDQDDTVTLKGLTVINAHGSSGNIYVSNGSLTMDHCVVRDCVATSRGGVIYGSYGTEINLIRSQFLNNSCAYDGGVLNAQDMAVNIDHCIFSGNTAGDEGGVIYAYSYGQDSVLNVSNSTFSGNRAEDGAVLAGYFDVDASFKNCIMANNENLVMSLYKFSESATVSASNCLFSGNGGGLYEERSRGTIYSSVNSLNGAPGSSGNISGQPHFAEANDFHLRGNSAAIDMGLPTGEPTDLDGLPRLVDGDQNRSVNQDIGPYEYDPDHPLIARSQPNLIFIRDVNAPNPESQTLSFRNTTPSPLNWQLVSDTAWLEVSQDSGTLVDDATAVTVSVNSDGMSRGRYSGMLTLSDPNAVNSPVLIQVSLQVRGKLSVPDDFSTIADAVRDAMPNEIIEVDGGTYTEGVTLDKPLTLIGRQDPNIATYQWIGIQIESDNCLVRGFTVSGAGHGLYVSGSDNTVKNMTLTNVNTGIYLTSGSGNRLDQISVSRCSDIGVNIQSSAQNTLTNVTIENCPRGFTLTGDDVAHYQQTIDESNTVDGKPIIYLVGVSDRVIAPNMGVPACVYLVDCTDVVLFNLPLSGNGRGVCLVNSPNNTLRGVKISDCDAGIWLLEAPNNALMKNTVRDCQYGIRLVDSAHTTLEDTTLIDNVASFSIAGGRSQEDDLYEQTIDTTNLINGLPIYYLVREHNVTIDETVPAACVYAIQCNNLTIADQTISDNTFGIALIESTHVEVRDVICRNNEQSNLLVRNCSDVTIAGGLFTNSQYGIDMIDSEQVTINNAECSYNNTGMQVNYTSFTITNSLIHNNTQSGGIRHYASSNRKGMIQGCTFINNSYGSSSYPNNGGAITGSSDYLTIHDSILWSNSPGTIPYPDSSEYTVMYSCIQDPLTGNGNFTEDPLLTSDGHLTIASPCIDAATPGRRIVTGVDMDGEKRRIGINVDIGADEYLDSDMDGLPDWFERELDPNGLAMNPGDDLDGDEYTNIEEYERFSGGALIPSGSVYVDPVNGDDLNLGNDPNLPKKTLRNALETLGPDERVVLMPGIHEGGLTLDSQNTLIQSSDPKNSDIVAATVIASTMQINSQGNYVEFSGLTFSSPSLAEGVVALDNVEALFSHCRFVENASAPLVAYSATIIMKHCEFSRNSGLAGAALVQSSDLLMENCLITDNHGNAYSQALTIVSEYSESKTTLINCTIANNGQGTLNPELADYYGMDYVPAILLYGANMTVTNSILWDSNPVIFDLQADGMFSQAWITYSNLSDTAGAIDPNWLGLGNISTDPGFARPGFLPGGTTQDHVAGDYHLLSTEGRWDSAQGVWVQDAANSRSLGAANPAWPAEDPNWAGMRLNLGAYGNTAQQSLAPGDWSLLGDLTNDGIVSALDETAFAQLQSNPLATAAYLNINPGDLDQDGDIDTEDLQILQSQMGQATPWHVEGILNDRWSEPPQIDTSGTETDGGVVGGASGGTGAGGGGR